MWRKTVNGFQEIFCWHVWHIWLYLAVAAAVAAMHVTLQCTLPKQAPQRMQPFSVLAQLSLQLKTNALLETKLHKFPREL